MSYGNCYIALSKVSQLVSVLFLFVLVCIASLFSMPADLSPYSSSIPVLFSNSNNFGCYNQVPHLHNPPSYMGMCHLRIIILPYPRYPGWFLFHLQ